MLVYKNLVREQTDTAEGKDDSESVVLRTSGMVGFEMFKKALVRISVISQEKLKGEQGADEFREKLEADTQKRDSLLQKQKVAHDQQASNKKGE